MKKILVLAVWTALIPLRFCWAANSITENFGAATISPLLHNTNGYVFGPSASPAGTAQQVVIGDRRYISTVASDYNTVNFIYDLTITINPGIETGGNPPENQRGIIYMGIGSAQPDPTWFTAPGTSAYLGAAPSDYSSGVLGFAIAPSTGSRPTTTLPPPYPGNGTHRLRIAKSGDTITFACQTNYAGGPFVPTLSTTKSLAQDLYFLNASNSRLFFGADTPARINNLQITVTSSTDLTTGLVAYYPFDGNANDASGNGHNGTLYSATTATDRFGNPSSAFAFNGTNAYINIGTGINPNQFTIGAWIWIDHIAIPPMAIVSKIRAVPAYYYQNFELRVNPDGKLYVTIPNGFSWTALSSTTILSVRTWHHVDVTYDGNIGKLYIDGAPEPGQYQGAYAQSDVEVTIGARPEDGGRAEFFPGMLDDVRVYNRALSATEVAQLYAGGVGPVSVSNVRASQRTGTKLVDIFYDLANPQGNALAVSVAVSTNNGTSFNLPATSFTPVNGSSTTPGNNRQVTWDAGTDWNNRSSSQVKFRITASGTLTADSPSTTVNTLDSTPANPIAGNRPVVQDVSSAYCSAIQHAYFLNGVSLNQTFTANVNWNGKTPGSIKFTSPGGTRTGATQTYNVGTDFGVGGTLMVQAVASDGTVSLPYYANFDIAALPPVVGALLNLSTISGDLKYRTSAFDLDIFQGRSGVATGVPLPDETLAIQPMLRLEAEVDLNGLLTFKAAVGEENKLKLNGTQGVRPDGKFGKAAAVDFGLDVQGRIVAAYSPDTVNWSVRNGYLGLRAFGKYTSPPYYVYAPPPIYVKADISGDIFFGVDVLSLSPPWNPTFQLNSESFPEIKGILGCGFSSMLAVEGYVAVMGKFDVTGPPTIWHKLGVGGKIGGQLVIIGFGTAPLDIWSGNYWIINDSGQGNSLAGATKTFAHQINALDTNGFKPLSRDYLNKNYATFVTDKARPALSLLNVGASDTLAATPIQENVFPYSEPSLAVNSTNRILLWVWDNPERSVENRTELIWSRWNGTSWSNPTSVWNDATADFTPTVKVFTDGSALGAWQNESSVLSSGATLEIALSGLEIAVAQFNPNTGLWSSTNLTSNAYLDRSPTLAAGTNGKALLTWIGNESNSLLGATNAVNTIHSRLWNGSSWQDAGDIATGVPMLLWSATAFDGTNGVFLAALDADDDQSTVDDQELWGATFGGATWSAFTKLTTNTMQNTKPQAVYDSTGTLLVAWYQGSNIVIHAGDLNLGSPMVAGTLGGSSSSKDFKLVTGPAGQVSMVWEDLAADGTGPDPFLLNYDPTLGVWSQPLRLLNTTNELERSFSAAYATNGALLMAYNRVAVTLDTNNVPQFGQVDLMFMDYLIGSDLAVSGSDITLSTNAVPGQPVNILALVRNIGELAATNLQAAFYDGNPSGGGVQIGSTQTVPGVLPAGSNTTVQVTWLVPNTTSNRTIYVVVDPASAQLDRNLANNTATLTVLAPDLQISDMTVLQPSPTNRVINARCVNLGTIPTLTSVDVEFRRGSSTGTVLTTVPISALPTNGVYDASFQWDLSGLIFTSAFEIVYATIDPANIVTESDEGNNVRIVQVMTSLDSDGDGLLDGDEMRLGSNPYLWDTDGNGLSDSWEYRYFGTPTGNDPNADPDGDGLSNLQESLAGSDPLNANSGFRITSVQQTGSNFRVTWQTAGGRTNIVQRATGIGSVYSNRSANMLILGNGDVTTNYLDIGAATNSPSRFYRIRLVP